VGLGAVVILAIGTGVLIALDRAVSALLGIGGASSGTRSGVLGAAPNVFGLIVIGLAVLW
jgi:hypothetical protein